MSIEQAREFLVVLKILCQLVLSPQKLPDSGTDEDSDSEDDDEGEEQNTMDQSSLGDEEHCLRDCKIMMNDPATVNRLVSATELSLANHDQRLNSDAMLCALCGVCHQLLLQGKRNNVHDNRLLNTLAFKPALLHRLWGLVISAKQETSISKPSPLLTVR